MRNVSQREIVLIQKCIKEIEHKIGCGRSADWSHHYFVSLSDDIHKKTGVGLSVSTLKRFFGKDKDKLFKRAFNFQKETKNTLVRYLGYANWHEYGQKNKSSHFLGQIKQFINEKEKSVKWILVPSLIVFCILYLINLFLLNGFSLSGDNIPSFYFSGRNLKGSVPHTVAVNYDISNFDEDVILDFGEYYSKREMVLPQKNHIVTHTYYAPYYYRMKMKYNNKILAQHNVMVKSKGWWPAIISDSDYFHVDPDQIKDGRKFIFTPGLVNDFDIDTNKAFQTEFKFIRPFDLSLDEVFFEADIKAEPINTWAGCYTVAICLLGTKEDLNILFTNKGCSSMSNIKAGGLEIEGKNADLSSLGIQFFDWIRVGIKTSNQELCLFINKKEIFSCNYPEQMGKFAGIHFLFSGCGAVDDILLKNVNEDTLIYESF